MSNITPNQLKEQVANYTQKRSEFEKYTTQLRTILETACKKHFPCAFVQARAKDVASFAEKVIRKADKYNDPVNQFTDLSAARVIVQTLDQVEAVREFIRNNFHVCEEDDKGAALGEDVFGYGDVHFIVQLKNTTQGKDFFAALGIAETDIIQAIGEKKAEIQIRTWLQHAIADALHDRIYKTPLKFPREIIRLAKMLDAIRENADKTMNSLCKDIDSRLANYSSFASKKQVEEEIVRLELLENELAQSKIGGEWKIALRRARFQSAIGEYNAAISTLGKYAKANIPTVLTELGNAYYRLKKFDDAKIQLEEATVLLAKPETAIPYDNEVYNGQKGRAHFLLALVLEKLDEQETDILHAYQHALDCESGNPYYFSEAIRHRVRHGEPHISLSDRTSVRAALETSHGHIKDGTELPYSCFVSGRLNALLGEPLAALADYALGVAIIRSGIVAVPPSVYADETSWLNGVGGEPRADEHVRTSCCWCARLLKLAERCKKASSSFAVKVKIITGGAAKSFNANRKPDLEAILATIMTGFGEKIISGGTTCGVPGSVGDVAEKTRFAKDRLIGYIPKHLPADAPRDMRYTLREAGYSEFTPEQIITCWEDLLKDGIAPSEITLIGFGGGPLSALEYRIALAFGAQVWIFDGFGGTATDIVKDDKWTKLDGLFVVPDDEASRQAFSIEPTQTIDPASIEAMAGMFHENYRNDQLKGERSKLKTWCELNSMPASTFRTANIEQAKYAVRILEACGFGVCPQGTAPAGSQTIANFTNPDGSINLGFKAGVERMAELEHGRWNIERLRDGWRYGPTRNDTSKIHPCIVPWEKLSEEIKGYDRQAVVKFPEVLREAGLEVYRTI